MPAYEDVYALRGDLNVVKDQIRGYVHQRVAEMNNDLTTLKETYNRQNRIVTLSREHIQDSVWHSPARASAMDLFNHLQLRQTFVNNELMGQVRVVRTSLGSINDGVSF
ncbi:MAG TPA: hypothetical protein PKB15_00640 [Acidimicrobiia bacterium]|nr:hypothetical protein [Acidimicrobiia bacterium]